jgi:hypothetical protein
MAHGGGTIRFGFSANAIHWVSRKLRVRKTSKALGAGGTLAIFRNTLLRSGSEIESEIDTVMDDVPAADEEPDSLPKEIEFRDSGEFEAFTKLRYEGSQVYEAESYADLLFTRQRYHRFSPEIRRERVRKVGAIVRDAGRTILVKYVTHLLLARKTKRRRWWKFS